MHFILVFSTQVSYFNLRLKLSFKLSDFMFFFRDSLDADTLLHKTRDDIGRRNISGKIPK